MINKIKVFEQDLPENCCLGPEVSIDTETLGLNLSRDRLALLQITDGNDLFLIKFPYKSFYDSPNLIKILSNKSVLKIFHFARFDIAVIKKYFGVEMENIFCTKIASFLVRTYSSKHSLKELCRELLNVNISKSQQTSFWGAESLTNEQKEYAANDVKYLHKLKDILHQRLILENREEIAKKIFEFIPVRANLDLLGWNDFDVFSHNVTNM